MAEFGEHAEQDKETTFHIKLMRLLREAVLEGVLDPSEGLNFVLVSAKMPEDIWETGTFPPRVDMQKIAEYGKFIVTLGFPNPLDEVNDMLLSPDERKAKDLLSEIEVVEAFKQLLEPPEDDQPT